MMASIYFIGLLFSVPVFLGYFFAVPFFFYNSMIVFSRFSIVYLNVSLCITFLPSTLISFVISFSFLSGLLPFIAINKPPCLFNGNHNALTTDIRATALAVTIFKLSLYA